jgi:Uma2 family endonuclease
MATATPERLDVPTDNGEPDGLYEVIDGRIVEKAMGAYECWLASVMRGVMGPYIKANPIGRVVQEMIFDLRPHVDRERRPDVAFVSFDRWARDRRIPQARSWAVVPDLAIEIISRTNTADEVAEKLEEYFKVGVRQVWVVYPRQSKVYAYTSTTKVRVLAPGDELDGGDVLPGFRLSITDLIGCIRSADDLDGQVGDNVPGPSLGDPPIPRPAFERDERDIRPPLTIDVRSEIEDHLLEHTAEWIRLDVGVYQLENHRRKPTFISTHRLLDNAAVDDFVQTLGLALVYRDVEPLGSRCGHGRSPFVEDRIVLGDDCTTRASASDIGARGADHRVDPPAIC